MFSKNILPDLKSGLVVFLVALPLCLGIALACHAPLFSGILAGVVGGIVVTVFSGSVLSVSGPAAGLTAIVLSSVAILGSYSAFMAAVVFAGVLQIVFGVLKAGNVSNFVPNSVIKGMLAGIGIILIIKQVPHLVGYDLDPEGDFEFIQEDGHNTFSDLFYMLNYITPGAVIVGAISIVILILTERKWYKHHRLLSNVPGPLWVVVIGILLNVSFQSRSFLYIEQEHLVKLPMIKNAGEFYENLVFPDFSAVFTQQFWWIVITLS